MPSRFKSWVARRVRELSLTLFPTYFTKVATTWQGVLWGGSVAFAAWGINFMVSNQKYWITWTAIVVALLFAGYYVWRADHIHLIPHLEVNGFTTAKTPVSTGNEIRTYVQLLPKCVTKTRIIGCEANLIQVQRRSNITEEWQPTAMNEAVPLEWSIYGPGSRIIQPGVEPRLNVCYVSFFMGRRDQVRQIFPAITIHLLRWESVFKYEGFFRFDIRLTSENCPPVDVSVSVSLTPSQILEPVVELL
jgi:hypothetical protein